MRLGTWLQQHLAILSHPLIHLLPYLTIEKKIYVITLSQLGIQVHCHRIFNRLLVLDKKNALYKEQYKFLKKQSIFYMGILFLKKAVSAYHSLMRCPS